MLQHDKTAARLSRDPFRISRALARTKQGAEWLLQSWIDLRAVLDVNGGWDEAQCELARTCLGFAKSCGDGGKISIGTDAAVLAAVVEREVNRLQGLLESSLIALDGGAQAMAMAGMPGEEDPETKKHRKYEAAPGGNMSWPRRSCSRARPASRPGTAAPRPRRTAGRDCVGYGPDPDFDTDQTPEPEPEPRAGGLRTPDAGVEAGYRPRRRPEPAPEERRPIRRRSMSWKSRPPSSRSRSPSRGRSAANGLRREQRLAGGRHRNRVRNRRLRRALEKQAREAARRKGRPLL